MARSLDPHRFTRRDAERDNVLDLEVDHIADSDAVPEAVVDDLDRCPLDAEDLAYERRHAAHRAAHLPAEDADELVELLVRSALVDEDAEAPVPFGHHLGRVGDRGDSEPADVGAVDLTFANVEDERDAAVVVVAPWSSDVVHGHTSSHEHVST